jgi:hypothetical protein
MFQLIPLQITSNTFFSGVERSSVSFLGLCRDSSVVLAGETKKESHLFFGRRAREEKDDPFLSATHKPLASSPDASVPSSGDIGVFSIWSNNPSDLAPGPLPTSQSGP